MFALRQSGPHTILRLWEASGKLLLWLQNFSSLAEGFSISGLGFLLVVGLRFMFILYRV